MMKYMVNTKKRLPVTMIQSINIYSSILRATVMEASQYSNILYQSIHFRI